MIEKRANSIEERIRLIDRFIRLSVAECIEFPRKPTPRFLSETVGRSIINNKDVTGTTCESTDFWLRNPIILRGCQGRHLFRKLKIGQEAKVYDKLFFAQVIYVITLPGHAVKNSDGVPELQILIAKPP